jgi:hypothetical protein
MDDAYTFVDAVRELPGKIKAFEDTIAQLVKQTVECALFIREYTGHGFIGVNYGGNVHVLADS